MELLELMRHRRSVRHYTGEPIQEEDLKKILQAGMLSASGKGRRPWEFILVRDKEMLKKLSLCREGAANQRMFLEAGAAIVILGESALADTWIEDCSSVMTNMHLMADALGLGSCWIQGRLRPAVDGQSTDAYVRQLLGFPEPYMLAATLVVGVCQDHPAPYELEQLPSEKIHFEVF